MKRKFIIGPPGTGKTTRLVEIYYSRIQKYTIEKKTLELLEENKKEILKTVSSKNAVYPEIFFTSSTKKRGLKKLKAYISSFATN